MSPPSATHWQTLAVSFSSCTIAPSLDNVVVIVVSSTRGQRWASRRAAGAPYECGRDSLAPGELTERHDSHEGAGREYQRTLTHSQTHLLRVGSGSRILADLNWHNVTKFLPYSGDIGP